jgi:hypothetical protein
MNWAPWNEIMMHKRAMRIIGMVLSSINWPSLSKKFFIYNASAIFRQV